MSFSNKNDDLLKTVQTVLGETAGPLDEGLKSEGFRKVGEHKHESGCCAKIYYNSADKEYRNLYHDHTGKYLHKADSFHSDKDDAWGTAKAEVEHMAKRAKPVKEETINEISDAAKANYALRAKADARGKIMQGRADSDNKHSSPELKASGKAELEKGLDRNMRAIKVGDALKAKGIDVKKEKDLEKLASTAKNPRVAAALKRAMSWYFSK